MACRAILSITIRSPHWKVNSELPTTVDNHEYLCKYRPFTKNAAAQCLYFFKSCYFIASSFQIVAGYPVKIIGYLLASSYNTVSCTTHIACYFLKLSVSIFIVFVYLGLAFLVYRLIPLLPELRETMDWTFSDTSLSLINWFKVQEIYSLIYLVKVQRNREKVTFCATST